MSEQSPSPTRRSVLANTAAMGALGLATAASTGIFGGTQAEEVARHNIRPFRVNYPEEALIDLRRRISATRWPGQEPVTDETQGVKLATMQELARYWATDYDWRKIEAKLNSLPQFITEIGGLDIHFIHVRSKHENALPLIVTHGWPGSVIEQLKIIDPLTNPTAHGASGSDAFHLVIPSMPGYGFSAKPTTTGWDPARIARAWDTLMKRLGYPRYVSQGGDWGARVSEVMARHAPAGLLGVHTNLLLTLPPEIVQAIGAGEPAPAGLSEKEKAAYEQRKFFAAKGSGYFIEQATRPQTIGYSLTDSPVGLAAWMIDHDGRSCERISQLFDGRPFGDITRDDILDNSTLYWLTNTGTSSGRLYWENAAAVSMGDISVPAAFTVFPDEIYRAPRSWVERVFKNLIYFNAVDKGGHFAAWEEPELFSAELRAAFRSLRQD